ncbi:MAG: methyltransferase domain-containing protein [Planctomycetota bacterium]
MKRLIAWIPLVALLACAHVPRTVEEASVKPGINRDFLDPNLDVDAFRRRFEGESREIFARRSAIADLLRLREGMNVADIGAGTGFFSVMFADRVGPSGRVYAVEIAKPFVDHIRRLASERGVRNLEPILCTERSVELPEESIDLAFVCDTYHHFEYPRSTLASIRRALRPGGELVIVDFVREEGKSRDWVLQHVRAGLGAVEKELDEAGFDLVAVEPAPFLRENYFARFRRR